MKRALALITAACIATPALALGDREQGALAGILGTLIYQQMQRDGFGRHPAPVVVQPPVVVQQPQIIYAPAPQPQVIIQNTGIVCPQGLAPFYNQRFDRYGRAYYIFDGCR
jgi:hypothetical protein